MHERTLSLAIARAARSHRAVAGELLASLGLHPGQEMLLFQLWNQDGQSPGKLADRLRIEPPTATKMLSRLESNGLVERRRDLDDGRSSQVYLTARGRALEQPTRAAWAELERRTVLGLNENERDLLARLLDTVRANLESRGPGSC